MLYNELFENLGLSSGAEIGLEAVAVALAVFLTTVIITHFVLPVLRAKKLGQNISGYVQEHKNKQGTPTMGGICFIMSILLVMLAWFILEMLGFLGQKDNRMLITAALTLCLGVGNGMIGFIAGDMLGRFIFGKSYTEKQAQQEKTEAAAQNIPQFDFNNIKMPYGGNTAFNDDEFLKLQQMYNQAANSSGLNSTNPFTPSMPYQMNPNNSSTF